MVSLGGARHVVLGAFVFALGACVASAPDVDPATPTAPLPLASATAAVPTSSASAAAPIATAADPCPPVTVPGYPPIRPPCPIYVPPQLWPRPPQILTVDLSKIPPIPGMKIVPPGAAPSRARPPVGRAGDVFVTVERRERMMRGSLLRLRRELRLTLLTCYGDELLVNGSTEGVVALSVEVTGPNLRVVGPPARVGTLSESLVDCAIAVIRDTKVEPAPSGTITVGLQFRFVPPERVP